MNKEQIPELWQWSEFYCPWCYISAVRLRKILPEFAGKVRLRERYFPLEIYGSGPPIKQDIAAEIWLAALQEPEAEFAPFPDRGWPATTLLAFQAAWIANQQSEEVGFEMDFRLREAFFAYGRNIGRADVIIEIAREVDLDMKHFQKLFESDQALNAILQEGKLGKEQYHVRGVPTIMTSQGKRFHHPIAYPEVLEGKIYAVGALPCCGEGCYQIIRAMFTQTLNEAQEHPFAEME